jgi:hypothetical protein
VRAHRCRAVTLCLDHDDWRRVWFNLGVVCFALSLGVVLYMSLWVRYVENVWLQWEVYCPNQLRLGALSGLAAFVFFTIGLWPVYSLFTVAILGVLFFGALMTAHFIPCC